MLDIFQEAGLPLWLRPYEVLATSSYTALIETIPDTVSMCYPFLQVTGFQVLAKPVVLFYCFQASLHSIKSRYPNITSLRDFFVAKYQENSPSFKLAQVINWKWYPSDYTVESFGTPFQTNDYYYYLDCELFILKPESWNHLE